MSKRPSSISAKDKLDTYTYKSASCWIWIGGLVGVGYGEVWFGGKYWASHRLSYTVYKGEIPDGMEVCHTCDNRKCINPEHLFVGTRKDNAEDMSKKGRALRGERGTNVKLTNKLVAIIRKYRGKLPQTRIAEIFSISQAQVCRVMTKRNWSHI